MDEFPSKLESLQLLLSLSDGLDTWGKAQVDVEVVIPIGNSLLILFCVEKALFEFQWSKIPKSDPFWAILGALILLQWASE